jgi:hypothetical protein
MGAVERQASPPSLHAVGPPPLSVGNKSIALEVGELWFPAKTRVWSRSRLPINTCLPQKQQYYLKTPMKQRRGSISLSGRTFWNESTMHVNHRQRNSRGSESKIDPLSSTRLVRQRHGMYAKATRSSPSWWSMHDAEPPDSSYSLPSTIYPTELMFELIATWGCLLRRIRHGYVSKTPVPLLARAWTLRLTVHSVHGISLDCLLFQWQSLRRFCGEQFFGGVRQPSRHTQLTCERRGDVQHSTHSDFAHFR